MAATMRRARNYKEKSTVFTFGHFALPVAAVIAIGLLFVGIKMFFLSPPRPTGIPVTSEIFASGTHDIPAPLIQEPDFALTEDGLFGAGIQSTAAAAEPAEVAGDPIILAGPLSARDTPITSSAANAASTDTARTTPAANTNTARPAAPARANTTTPAAPANSRWGVQVGSFVDANNANYLAQRIQREGYTTSVSRIDLSGTTYHRVRVSAGNTREDANRLAAELQRKGHPVSVVPMS